MCAQVIIHWKLKKPLTILVLHFENFTMKITIRILDNYENNVFYLTNKTIKINCFTHADSNSNDY